MEHLILSVKDLDIIIFSRQNCQYCMNIIDYFKNNQLLNDITVIEYHSDNYTNTMAKEYGIICLPTIISKTTGKKIQGARDIETIVDRLQHNSSIQ